MKEDEFILEIPVIRCDLSLIGASGQLAEIEGLMQWKSCDPTGDWILSTGEVRCNDTSLVTDILLNLLPEFKRGDLICYKKEHRVGSIMDLRVRCKESCLPFIILNRELIHFLKDTETALQLSVLEEVDRLERVTMRLNLILRGNDLPFEHIEKITGKIAEFKRRRDQFPASVGDLAEDTWIYATDEFGTAELGNVASTFCSSFSGKRLETLTDPQKSAIELIIYHESLTGISFETVIPEGLILLAVELGTDLRVGSYLRQQTLP